MTRDELLAVHRGVFGDAAAKRDGVRAIEDLQIRPVGGNQLVSVDVRSFGRRPVAVFTIGIIGFLLDRVMFALQQAFTFSGKR